MVDQATLAVAETLERREAVARLADLATQAAAATRQRFPVGAATPAVTAPKASEAATAKTAEAATPDAVVTLAPA
jgi:hypothetical protein